MREQGVVPDALAGKPVLGRGGADLWEAFWTLSASRQIGYAGVQPIPVSEMRAYWGWLQETDVMAEQLAAARLANGLCKMPKMEIAECQSALYGAVWHRSLQRIPEINAEVSSAVQMPLWLRRSRFLSAMQRMDAAYLDYERERSKQ